VLQKRTQAPKKVEAVPSQRSREGKIPQEGSKGKKQETVRKNPGGTVVGKGQKGAKRAEIKKRRKKVWPAR